MPTEPRRLVEQLEATASLPRRAEERFSGYGVMGLIVYAGKDLPGSSLGIHEQEGDNSS